MSEFDQKSLIQEIQKNEEYRLLDPFYPIELAAMDDLENKRARMQGFVTKKQIEKAKQEARKEAKRIKSN